MSGQLIQCRQLLESVDEEVIDEIYQDIGNRDKIGIIMSYLEHQLHFNYCDVETNNVIAKCHNWIEGNNESINHRNYFINDLGTETVQYLSEFLDDESKMSFAKIDRSTYIIIYNYKLFECAKPQKYIQSRDDKYINWKLFKRSSILEIDQEIDPIEEVRVVSMISQMDKIKHLISSVVGYNLFGHLTETASVLSSYITNNSPMTQFPNIKGLLLDNIEISPVDLPAGEPLESLHISDCNYGLTMFLNKNTLNKVCNLKELCIKLGYEDADANRLFHYLIKKNPKLQYFHLEDRFSCYNLMAFTQELFRTTQIKCLSFSMFDMDDMLQVITDIYHAITLSKQYIKDTFILKVKIVGFATKFSSNRSMSPGKRPKLIKKILQLIKVLYSIKRIKKWTIFISANQYTQSRIIKQCIIKNVHFTRNDASILCSSHADYVTYKSKYTRLFNDCGHHF